MWHCNQSLNHNRNLQQASRNRLSVTVRMVRPLTLNLSCPACPVDLEDRTGDKFFAEKKQRLPRETNRSFLFNWGEFNRGICEPYTFLASHNFSIQIRIVECCRVVFAGNYVIYEISKNWLQVVLMVRSTKPPLFIKRPIPLISRPHHYKNIVPKY